MLDQALGSHGRQRGRYEMRGALGKGGMATVVRAFDHTRQQLVAIKRLAAEVDAVSFEREYQALKSLSHPRIIRVFDYGVDEDGPFYTMELLEGEDLLQRKPIPWRETCQYLRDVATCLSLLHARRLLHRDVSARNVRRTADGRCKLIDFGALVDFGPIDSIVGTAPYVAPETLHVRHLDQRADLYSLGALAYRCLTGELPYPARHIADLPAMWKRTLAPPSGRGLDIPPQLDELVLGLLDQNPLARPSTAAEVILRLDAIVELQGDDEGERRSLAQSFLSTPKFVGRAEEMAKLEMALRGAVEGRGGALCIVGPRGVGRSRLLDEVAIRGELAGATVLKTDACMQTRREGTLRALVEELDDRSEIAPADRSHRRLILRAASDSALCALEPAVGACEGERSGQASSAGPIVDPPTARADRPPPSVKRLLAASHSRPLIVLVDNVERADSASLAALVDLARAAVSCPLLVVLAESTGATGATTLGLGPLAAACSTIALDHLSAHEMSSLLRGVFGDAPRIERLSEWLHAESGGSPLHAIELARCFVARGVIRHERGVWLLPQERPELLVSDTLGDALRGRIDGLSPDARFLAGSLALQELEPSLELCRLLAESQGSVAGVFVLLDELVAAEVLRPVGTNYRFTSAAVRQAAVERLVASERRSAHRALGHALLQLSGDRDLLTLQAGWHFIRGGDELRGADMISRTTECGLAITNLLANLHPVAEAAEAALRVYWKHRLPVHRRIGLLSALAQAGYYAHHSWARRYGDTALDALQSASGLGLARQMQRWLGGPLGLVLALGFACVRHYLRPKHVRGGSFRQVLIHAGCVTTSLAAVAATCIDPDRADRVTRTLHPLRVVPPRLSLHLAYRMCEGFQHIARESPVRGFAHFDKLAQQLDTPGHFLFMPEAARDVYTASCHLARGAFAMMAADSEQALVSATRLDASGFSIFRMIASQLRYLYHVNRGEAELAQPYRDEVELHAARYGSAWQVEIWEAASLVPLLLTTSDLVGLKQVAHRLDKHSESVPSMNRYAELARAALQGSAPEFHHRVASAVGHLPPRSYVGWSSVQAAEALVFNQRGEHEAAWRVCEHAMLHMQEGDRRFVTLFLMLDIQAAVAEAGLGRVDAAFARLDRELRRHWHTSHPMTLGLLLEARARIAFHAGRRSAYLIGAVEAARWLRPTRHPGLIAIAERLAQLETSKHTETDLPLRPDTAEFGSTAEVRTTNDPS